MPDLMEGWSIQRRTAQPFVTRAAQEGDIFQRWYEQAREAGISYRRSDMLEDWRREKGLALHQSQLERMSWGNQPPQSWMTDRPWDGLRTSLVYEYRFTGHDVAKDEDFERYIGVATNKRLTKGEAIEAFMREYVEAGVYGPLENVQLELVSVWHKSESEYED